MPDDLSWTEQKLVEASIEASKRTRQTFLVLQLFSLLVAVGFFNFLPTWAVLRVEVASLAAAFAETCPDVSTRDLCIQGVALARGVKDQARIESAKKDAAEQGWNKERLASSASGMREHQAKFMQLQIPFTGMSIDPNGLGLVAALGLAILLVWLSLAIERERENLESVQTVISKHAAAMEVVDANQLFAAVGGARPWPLRWIGSVTPYAGFSIPLALCLTILWIDYDSRPAAYHYSERLTLFTLITEGALALLNTLLTAACIWGHHRASRAYQDLDASTNAPNDAAVTQPGASQAG